MAKRAGMWKFAGWAAVVLLCAAGLWAGKRLWLQEAQPQETQPKQILQEMTIRDGATFQMEYTLIVEGEVVDSSEGKDPFTYVYGSGQIIPGLERQLAGLRVGDEREITVTPEEGYGRMDPDAVVEVPRGNLPGDIHPEVGMVVGGVDGQGRPFRATIREIGEENVKLDMNHPLAGKELLFKVKVVEISPGQ